MVSPGVYSRQRTLRVGVKASSAGAVLAQCGMTLAREGRALEVQPWPEFPVNEGALCRKGWTATGLPLKNGCP